MRNGVFCIGYFVMICVYEVGINMVIEVEEVVFMIGCENVYVLGGMFSVNV